MDTDGMNVASGIETDHTVMVSSFGLTETVRMAGISFRAVDGCLLRAVERVFQQGMLAGLAGLISVVGGVFGFREMGTTFSSRHLHFQQLTIFMLHL